MGAGPGLGEMLKPLWNIVGARWGHLKRLMSGDREVASPMTRLWCSCGRGPGKWNRPAERPRDSLLSFSATPELHVQVEARLEV